MHKILVISPSWVGDCMLMQPMLMRLRQRHPDCRIDVFAPSWTAALLRAMPEVHEVIINPFPHGALQLAARYRLGKRLRAACYDQAVVLPNSWKSALVPFFARIPLRTGFTGEARHVLLNDRRKLDKTILPLMVERFAQLAEAPARSTPVGTPLLRSDPSADAQGEIPRPLANPKLAISEAQRSAALHKLNLTLDQPVAVFCPGAEYGPAKRWPAAYYADIAQRLRQHGYAVWLIGSGKDKPVADEINRLAGGNCINLCGNTDLGDALALLASAQLVISNDSGLMHLAAALDRPMLALFGSSSPQFTPPLSAQAQVIKLDIECSPCFERECPLGHFNCMMKLTPDLLWEKLQYTMAIDRSTHKTETANQ
ncbi:MAG TPA: lipopolysaccharide heptosyltransferase II [Gallionella sp.]|nr:lipopolysaccharide heptosyltransferase II [Gallionella sp.]